MMRHMKKWIALLLTFVLAVSLTACGGGETESSETAGSPVETQAVSGASENGARYAVLAETADWLLEAVPEASVGSVGGEWAVLGLARSGIAVPEEYYETYAENAAAYTAERGGVLHAKKYTEYSRVILAWTAIGKDPTDVGGFNLLVPLADFEQTVFQGINGPIFALLALDSGNYEIPKNTAGTTQATRERYVDYILNAELPNGGWSFAGGEAEPDITAMALQALAKYRDRQDVADAVERGLTVLSQQQNENGGYTAYDAESSESIAQVIVALTELGIPAEDPRFVKNGNTLEDRLMVFRTEEGGFRHILDGDTDLMATEQAFYALAALNRVEQGKTSLYTMTQ